MAKMSVKSGEKYIIYPIEISCGSNFDYLLSVLFGIEFFGAIFVHQKMNHYVYADLWHHID